MWGVFEILLVIAGTFVSIGYFVVASFVIHRASTDAEFGGRAVGALMGIIFVMMLLLLSAWTGLPLSGSGSF